MILEKEINQKVFRNEYHKLAVNMYYTYIRFMQLQNRIFKRYGLTVAQFNILRILRGRHPQPASVNLLKERMLDKMSDASRLVDRLILKDLVERKICPNDRRKAEVLITPKGMSLLKELEIIEEKHKETFGNLSEEEVKKLNNLLDKMRG